MVYFTAFSDCSIIKLIYSFYNIACAVLLVSIKILYAKRKLTPWI